MIWLLIKTYWRPLAVAAALLAVAAGIGWYGHTQYRAGYERARADAKLAAVALEQGMQYERDQADARYRGAVLAREAAEKSVADQRDRIVGLLHDLRRAKAASAGGGSDGAGADGIGVLISCVQEYDAMARDAARLADKVGGLQGYVRAIRKR